MSAFDQWVFLSVPIVGSVNSKNAGYNIPNLCRFDGFGCPIGRGLRLKTGHGDLTLEKQYGFGNGYGRGTGTFDYTGYG